MQLIQRRYGVPLHQQLVGQEGENVEEHSVAHTECHIGQAAHTEDQEAVGTNIGVAVEELGVGAHTQGAEPQTHILQLLSGIEGGAVIVLQLPLHQLVQVSQGGELLRRQAVEVRIIANAPLGVELCQHDLQGVKLGIGEVFVGPEEVLQEGNVLGQHCPGAGQVRFRGLVAAVPELGFQHIDLVFSAHQVNEAAAQSQTQVFQFMLRVQGDHALAGFQDVDDQVLHQVGFALAGVAQNEDVGGGLVIVPLVEVYQQVGAEAVFANVEAPGIGFAGVVKREEIGNGTGRKHTFKGAAQSVVAGGVYTAKALLLL